MKSIAVAAVLSTTIFMMQNISSCSCKIAAHHQEVNQSIQVVDENNRRTMSGTLRDEKYLLFSLVSNNNVENVCCLLETTGGMMNDE